MPCMRYAELSLCMLATRAHRCLRLLRTPESEEAQELIKPTQDPTMTITDQRLAVRMRQAVYLLSTAVEDTDAGRLDQARRDSIAQGLEILTAALRDNGAILDGTVVE